jgi:hypothetical protein
MRKRWYFIICLLAVFIAPAAFPQLCPTLVDSPILSNSPDDIPPAETGYELTYAGSYVLAKADHWVTFIQTGPNEQKVWFSLNVVYPDYNAYPVYYNRRYRADGNSPWYWEFTYSKAITSWTNFPNAVLYSATPKYVDRNGVAHKYAMYLDYQPPACNGVTFGPITVAYSDDGVCWSAINGVYQSGGGVDLPCAGSLVGGDSGLISNEGVSVIDGGDTIYIIWVEGDGSTLVNGYLDQPYAHWGTISPSSSYLVSVPNSTVATPCLAPENFFAAQHWVSSCGEFNPLVHPVSVSDPDPDRFRSYGYFFNLSAAWDSANGDLYVSRGYPYPYDRHAVNCGDYCAIFPAFYQQTETLAYNIYEGHNESTSGCGGGSVAGYPNRYQVYKMHIGTLANFSQIHTGTWTLVSDNGNSHGYEQEGFGVPFALVSGQTSGTRDAGVASFLRDGAGFLIRNGTATIFAGSTARESLSQGPCVNTGNERNVAVAIP